MSEPKTLKEWLREWHGQCIPDQDNEPCETCTKTNPEKSRQCCEAEDTLRSLILASDKGPEVDEDWLIDKANSVLHALRHRFRSVITAEDMANMRNLLADVVIAGGIKVKED